VVSSPVVMRIAHVGVLLALIGGSALPAQLPLPSPSPTDETLDAEAVPAPKPTPPPPASLRASGAGVLESGGVRSGLPWVDAGRGVLVELAPLVDRLGGELVPGAFWRSAELRLEGETFVLASESAAVTQGTRIQTLSQPPVFFEGRVFVPLDLIPRTWGELLGVEARWDATGKRLLADRPRGRDVAVEASVVHLQGVTTVVLRFDGAPRVRIEERPGGWDLVAVGDRFVAPPVRPVSDPFVRALSVDPGHIRVELAEGIAAEHYRLRNPDRIVLELFRQAEGGESELATPRREVDPGGIRRVVLDPGHGGSETGAVGPSGTMEKELTLAIARTLAERLRAELGVEVALTRTDDVDLGLDDRSAFANQTRADLFVSIHLNSTSRGRGNAHGAETYFLSLEASDERAADAAALENLVGEPVAGDGSDGVDLQMLLWDLAQTRFLAASQRLASLVQEELNHTLSLPDRGVKQAPFRVLMGAAMPAVLVELGFISSTDEEQKLRDPDYRARLVETVVRAIARFKAEYDRQSGAGGAPE